ncbi:hypothetical protein ACFWH7_19585 [Cellulosimicrobium cellulans]|uniref:hypothetical protein n=1 Tax=Cellulosimicrobium cellulans TaxID=1710 RepID=UPI0036656C0B
MISEHVYVVEAVGTGHRVSPVSGTATLDESWSPYAQGDLTIPLPADSAVLGALDPREDARVRLTLTQRFGEAFTLADVTAGSGSSIAAWTADLAGGSLGTWSERYGRPYNAAGLRPSTRRRLNLGVRRRNARYAEGVVDLELASDEALLQDYALAETTPAQPAGATVRQAAQMVLARIGAVLGDGPDDGPIEADAAPWMPGQTAWDYIVPLVQSAGLRLYCDEHRTWHLVQPLAPTAGGLALSGATMTVLEDQLSRDDGWYDAVVITYRWRDTSDVERVRYDVATTENYTKTLALEYDRPYPGPGAAASILARARGRGRIEAATTVSDYSAQPGQAVSVTATGIPIQTGITTRVTWDLTTDEMQVRTRDLIDTPPNAWVLAPAGLRWTDVPAGTSWNDFDLTEVGN